VFSRSFEPRSTLEADISPISRDLEFSSESRRPQHHTLRCQGGGREGNGLPRGTFYWEKASLEGKIPSRVPYSQLPYRTLNSCSSLLSREAARRELSSPPHSHLSDPHTQTGVVPASKSTGLDIAH
ncbi:MAG: hypothetical protein ACE5KH_06430, partial [Candidatus Geothermarchaeales archaeon]